MKSLKNKISNRKTKKIKRSIKGHPKKVWMFRKGNLVVCYRVPFMKIQEGNIPSSGGGGGSPTAIDKSKIINLLDNLKVEEDKDLTTYIYDNKQKLAEDLLKHIQQPTLKPVYDSILNGSESENQEVLIDWIKKRKIAQEVIKNLKEKINSQKGRKIYKDEDLKKLESVLNDEDLCNAPSRLSSIASTVFDTMKTNATSLGEFLSSGPVDNKDQYNENIVQLLWFPKSSRHYKRGKSGAVDRKDFKMGDFMIYVQPEKYANTTAYISNMLDSVEDYFNDVLEGCKGPFCMKGDVKRKPIKHQVIRTIDHSPQLYADELKNGPLEIRN